MSDSSLDNAQLRKILRGISDQVQGPVRPDYITSMDSIDIEVFVSRFGSLAQACLEAGCDYRVTEGDPDVYAAGRSDAQQRQRLIEDLDRIVNEFDMRPTESNLHSYGRDHYRETVQEFGSWPAIVLEAGLDPQEIPDYVSPAAFREELLRLADLIGFPPSREFAARQSTINIEAYDARFPTWEVALESVGLDPDQIDPLREIVTELELLAGELGHRPNADEIDLYTQLDIRRIGRLFGSLEDALNTGDIPAERDLTPSGSLTVPPDGTAKIPSHTDILREIFTLRRRSEGTLDNFEEQQEAITNEGIIDQKHYEIQFGSVSDAFEYGASLDARSYKSPRDERVRDIPKELLAEYAQELGEILDRRPLIDEVVELTDATLEAYLEHFDSWEAVFEVEPVGGHRDPAPEVTPSTTDLLDDIESVGASIGRPPTPEDVREMGFYPVESVLRRFGSWPAALGAVGVEITTDLPTEYQALELTQTTIQRAERLYDERFDYHAVLRDDLSRIQIDLGRTPDREDVDAFGVYPLSAYTETFDAISSVVEGPTPDGRSETGLQPGEERSQLIADLAAVGRRFDRAVWPRDVALFGRYTIPSYLAIFGTLEEAFTEAELPTGHFPRSVTSWPVAWDHVFPDAKSFVDALRTQYEETGYAPTMAEMREVGISSQQCYEYYDTWEEALIVAGIPPERRSPIRSADQKKLLESLRELADELGRPPKTVDVEDYGEYSLHSYYNYYESWKDVLEDAGLTGSSSSTDRSDHDESGHKEATSTTSDGSDLVNQIMDDIERTPDENS